MRSQIVDVTQLLFLKSPSADGNGIGRYQFFTDIQQPDVAE